MRDDLLLGLDIGTGSCKCSLVNSRGVVVGQAVQEYSPVFPQPGWVEQNPADWYHSVIACLQYLDAQPGCSLAQVAAVGATGQMRGPTFMSGTGKSVRPSILWNDLRCEQEVAGLKTQYAEMLPRITHNPLNTMCTLPKLLWVMSHEPDTWQKTTALIYPKDFINFRLTGNLGTDLSDASGSSFYDLKRQTWSDEILDTFAIDGNKLPEIYPSTAIVGTVTRQAHQETGLPEGVPVVAGGSDATVELLATGIENTRQCKLRLGTSGALSTVVDQLDPRSQNRYYVWSYILPNQWMVDVNTRACANATVWLKDVFYQDTADSAAAYQKIGQEAERIPPGAEDLFFHPYLLGEDAPYWEPRLRGSFVGLTVSHQRAHCARAVLEGTGFALRDARSVLGQWVEHFETYIFVGGGVKNEVWRQIVADILGVNGQVAKKSDASVGAAMLAGIGTTVFSGVREAIEMCVQLEDTLPYDVENHQSYTQLFEKYVQIKQVCDGLYQGILDT